MSDAPIEAGAREDVAAVNTAKMAAFDEIAALLDVDSDPTIVVEHVKRLVENGDALAGDLSETAAALDAARRHRHALFGLATRLMSQLSWCMGYLAGDDQQLPDEVKATIDEAVVLLPAIGEESSPL